MSDNDQQILSSTSGMTVLPIRGTQELSLPFADDGVHAGFPAPAQSTMEAAIDLNKDLIENPESTFYARVEGDSMIGANIFEDDILIIDRSLTPSNGDIALCIVDGEFTVDTWTVRTAERRTTYRAFPDGEGGTVYRAVRVDHADGFSVWGVVTYVIHGVKHSHRRF